MVSKLEAVFNKVYLIEQYSMFHILEGTGSIEVDFQLYHDWSDKIIFLEKGQYIKFLSADFVVRRIEFKDEAVFRNKDVRVLFKHLVSLGYIDFASCERCQEYLSKTIFSDTHEIIDISSEQWFWQNPFQAKKEEYHLIFDIKDVVDQEFKSHLSNQQLSELIGDAYHAQALFKNKIGISVKSMLHNKRLLESKKAIAFSKKSIKEIAYDLGYKDPAYFNRVFKKGVGQHPSAFREAFDFNKEDLFLKDLYELLKNYHQEERQLAFYADQLHLSVKSLSTKVRQKLNTSLGQLIRLELINTAKKRLALGEPIHETAYSIGFSEANHFSTFFKRYTQQSPSEYQNKKYK